MADYADPLEAVCAYLRAHVGSLLDRTPANLNGIPADIPCVFRPDLPRVLDGYMPLAAITVRPAGGYTQYGKQPFRVADPRMDFICFARSQSRATSIAEATATELMTLGVSGPQFWEGTQLYSAEVHGGPVPLPDEQTLWPACWLQAIVVHGQLPAPAL